MTDADRERIAELRKRIAANKGKAHRADETSTYLRNRAARLYGEIDADRREIEKLGGKVIR